MPRGQAVAAVATARIAATVGHLLMLVLLAPIGLDHVAFSAPPPQWLVPAVVAAAGVRASTPVRANRTPAQLASGPTPRASPVAMMAAATPQAA